MRKMLEQIWQRTSIAIQISKIATRAVNRQKGKQSQKPYYSPNCSITLYVLKNVFHLKVSCFWFLVSCFLFLVFSISHFLFPIYCLKISNRFLKLSSAVFIVFKQIKTCAGWRKKNCVISFR